VDRTFTLNALAEIGDDLRAYRNVAFLVQNFTVMAALMMHVRQFPMRFHPTIICTNGILNLAAQKLLDVLVRRGAHLFYSVDFNRKGLESAAQVLARYPGAASPWRMLPADYARALRVGESAGELGALHRAARAFPELVAAMTEHGRAAHQDNLISALKADVSQFVLEEITPPRLGDSSGGTWSPEWMKV
jgi:uncharacterized protein (TIGR02679 family)